MFKPRNQHLHEVLMSKRGGAHEKTNKAKRKKLQQNLAKMIKEGRDFVVQSFEILNYKFAK